MKAVKGKSGSKGKKLKSDVAAILAYYKSLAEDAVRSAGVKDFSGAVGYAR